ncbi:uncharacterized transmembrane protein DDB_G0289901-like isoform X8 [Cyprinodon tularosa]|uniref:uncharacterized transmembrane protein DDB_G0289901-like isoform X8 n=1 Tax=Cyprinodon tularosa TaxID=77115 RepID=UPI0018E2598E|nr:uncharacterized transmembrane protein DDB_G0289901-like isoform X8 [Cyprinodon tularosa]
MHWIFTCTLLLLLNLFEASGKYVYIKEPKTWSAAQQYCQQEYAGLAPVSNQQDIVKMMELVNGNFIPSWIGMEDNDIEVEQLKIWGGGKMLFPTPGESTSLQGANSSPTTDYYVGLQTTAPFFCYKPVVVRKKKSWEDSWSYCKEHHNMLASVTSVAEMQLIQKELSKVPTTERVWIGLHFFPGDEWLWVDSQPLDYEVWGSGKKPQCPKVNTECAALQVTKQNISSFISNSVGSGDTSGNSGSNPGNPGNTSGNTGGNPGNSGGNPGNSGSNPGNSGGNPGNSGSNPGNSGSNPGNSGGNPGNSGSNPGNSGRNPGNSGGNPGNSGSNPGNSGSNPGNSGSNPGNSGGNPGNSGSNPGNSGGNPGNSGGNPGNSGGNPGNSGGNPGNSGSNPDNSGGNPGNSGSNPGNSGGNPGNSGGNPGNSGGNPGNSGGNPGNSGGNPGNSGGNPGNSGGNPGNSGGNPGNSGGNPGNSGGNPW